jgi:hypothetical protein
MGRIVGFVRKEEGASASYHLVTEGNTIPGAVA